MERLLFQKTIDLKHQLQELVAVSVKENLNYTLSKEGKRALGTLNIEGDYLYNQHKQHFEDVIEIDILAPFNRLEEGEEFYVEIQDYDYHITSGNLSLDIHVNAHGVTKKEDRRIFVDDEEALYEEIKELTRKEELIEVIEATIKENKKEDVLDAQGKYLEELVIEEAYIDDEIFDDEQTSYVNYPFYIAKKEDTYPSIASTFGIDEYALRVMNEDKPVSESCIIRLKK